MLHIATYLGHPQHPLQDITSPPFLSPPWRSGLQSIPEGLSWPIWLGICCQQGQVRTGAQQPAVTASRSCQPGLWLASGLHGRARGCTGSVRGLRHSLYAGTAAPAWPTQACQDPGKWSFVPEALEKRTAAQLPMSGHLWRFTPFRVDGLLGPLPVSWGWRLSWPHQMRS